MFELIELPYGSKDLEPVISAQTLSFHHGKHLQGYVDNLNKLLPGAGFLRICRWRRLCARLIRLVVHRPIRRCLIMRGRF